MRSKGRETMEHILEEYYSPADGRGIDVIFAHNDDMALGAIQAIKDAGQKPGKDIIIIGVDAVKGAFEAIVAGEMNCTVECSPLLGPQFVEAVKKLVAGETLPKITYSIEYVYDESNAKEELPKRQY